MVFAGFQSSLIARATPGMMEKGILKSVSVHRRVTFSFVWTTWTNTVRQFSFLSRTRSRSLDILSFACSFVMHVLPRLIMTRDTGTSLNSLKRSHLSINKYVPVDK